MIEPVITRCKCTDIREPDAWRPAVLTDLYVNVELTFWAQGEPCGDFQLLVASPEATRERGKRNWDDDRHTLWRTDFAWGEVVQAIDARAKSCAADTYDGVLAKLRNAFFWEYEDFEWVDP